MPPSLMVEDTFLDWDAPELSLSLFPAAPADTVELFAGPGGWDQGARILGLDLKIDGIEVNGDAVATARAAGHNRRHIDVLHTSPNEYSQATGLIASPPCPTFSPAGKQSGLGRDYQRVLDVWTSVGWDIPVEAALADLAAVEDERTALLAVAGVWALTMPNLRWLVMEQVPAVDDAWNDLSAELFGAEWEYVNHVVLDAADFGVPSRRKRTFLVAHRDGLGVRRAPGTVHVPAAQPEPLSMADALGWAPGHRINTRGNRRTSGGNEFSADQPSWCLTGKARTWEREDGRRLTAGEAGYLSGFPLDYPWRGSRSSQFQQAGDVVSPIMAAHVLAGALGIDPGDRIDAYRASLYERMELAA